MDKIKERKKITKTNPLRVKTIMNNNNKNLKWKKIKIIEQKNKKLIEEKSEKLTKHTKRNKNTNHINYKIFHLLHNRYTFVNAYVKISKNKGALTEGHEDEKIMEFFGIKKAEKIANQIKKDQYKFKPVKRTWIDKPGKKKKRPIDVPNQSDRIVQEAIRGILEAIYEPVFKEQGEKTENLSNNYGFRPNNSTWSAIEKLKLYSKRCNLAIEGDIVSAYNNVDHDILINILKQRIKDKKFIIFIKRMLKSGIMDEGRYEHSLSGTPQGGIVSPLLFNIYMLGLDQYIYKEFITPILKENENKFDDIESKEYSRLTRELKKSITKLKKLKKENPNDKKTIKISEKNFKRIRAIRNKTPSGDIKRLKKGAIYVRYADDWVLAITCKKKEAEIIKDKIAEFLKEHRKMQLDEEKTKITQTSKGYKFLGFEIRLNKTKIKLKRVLLKHADGSYTRPLRRTTSRNITIEPDSKRILKRMKIMKFCNDQYEPRARPAWIVYNEFQIVQKYAQIFRGIYVYYEPCKKLTRLSHISYILQYSCAKTLARRKKVSIRKIFDLYSTNLNIETTIQGTKENTTRKVKFLGLTELRKIAINRKRPLETYDPFRIQEHWRTKFKMYSECCICGETEGIALHHLNSIRSIKKGRRDKFETIRSQVNRIQIPVCNKCHQDITYGKYNDPRTPITFYNEFLAKL